MLDEKIGSMADAHSDELTGLIDRHKGEMKDLKKVFVVYVLISCQSFA